MSKSILVPTDFSKNANNALDYAISLAKKENAKIILLHAYHVTYVSPEVPMQYIDEITLESEQEAQKKLKLLSTKVTETAKLKCELITRQGLAVDLILETIESKKPTLVVMGTKGASGLKEVIMGSNTAKIIDKAECPVIAVPEKASFSPIKHITYATDYNTSDIDALKKLTEIGKLFNARITILHVCDNEYTLESEKEYMNKFKNKVAEKIKYDKTEFKLLQGKQLLKVMEDYISHESPDLFAMSTHHRNLFDRIFGTSSAKKMAYHTKIPLLVFHYKPEPIFFV